MKRKLVSSRITLLASIALASFLGTWWSGWGRVVADDVPVSADQLTASLLPERRTARLSALPPPPTQQEVIAANGIGQLDLLLRWLPGATASEVQSLAETMRRAAELGERSSATLSEPFWPLLLQRWFELDPQGVLAFGVDVRALSSDRNLKKLVGKSTLYGYWAQVDPDKALESSGDSLLSIAVLERLQLTEPWRALALARTLESGPAMSFVGLYAHAARQDLERALESAKAISGSLLRDDVLESILARVANKDPRRALDLAEELVSSDLAKRKAIHGIISVWIRNDPVAASEALADWGTPKQRINLAAKLAKRWAIQESPPTWIDALESSEERFAAKAGLAYALSDMPAKQEDARNLVADLGYDLRPGRLYEGVPVNVRDLAAAVTQMTVALAKKDRVEAMNFAARFERGPHWSRGGAMLGIMREWVMNDAPSLASYIQHAEHSPFRTQLALYYARAALAEQERIPWAKELDERTRQHVIEQLELSNRSGVSSSTYFAQ